MKKGQEEMVGFALILIVVAVIIIVLISFSIRPDEKVLEDYETESFILALLGTTTNCEIGYEFRTIQELIPDCSSNKICSDSESSCIVLKNAINSSLYNGWGQQNGVVGYGFAILDNSDILIELNEGNSSRNYKGFEYFASNDIIVRLKVYEIIS